MKKVLNTIFCALLLLWATNSFAEITIQQPTTKGATSFAIIVDSVTFARIGGAVEAYRASVEQDGLPSYIVVTDWKSPEEIRSVIHQLSDRQPKLEGVVFVGDIPIPMVRDAQHMTTAFKLDQEAPWPRSSVPSDRYYDDFHLKFTFLRHDSAHTLYYYYALAPDSPQRVEKDIYSARIKAPVDGIEKYDILKKYLLRVVEEKKKQNVLDNLLCFTGHGYHSQALAAWEGNAFAMQDLFPSLYLPGGTIQNLSYAMDYGMKDILLTKLQNPDLDVALFHAHGDVDMQFIVGDEPAATVDQHVEAIKRFIREKLRSAKRHKQSVAEALTYYTNQYHLPKTWFTDVFSDSLTAADSLADFKQDIHSEDIDRIAPQAKFVMFDECFNGSFHKENYIAGKYVFGNGKTVVAVANAVNVLQDLWANEQIGVLGYGVRVGSWHKFRNTIESHLIGDPTFHFTSTQTIDLQLLLSTKQHDASVWRKLLTHHDAAIRTLAVAMVSKIEGAAAEKEILNIFDTDPSMNVRLSALKSLAFLRSPAFEKALMKGIQDPYEFLRRISVRWMGEIGKEESIPALVNAAFNDPSERVQYNAHNALEQIGLGKAWPVIQSVDRSLPPSEIRKRIVETFERSVGRIRKDIDSESTPIILSDTASIKSRVSKLRTFRLYNYEEVIPVLIAAAENEHNPVRVRVAALETMGWYSFSYQRTTFLTSIDALLNQQKELTPAVQSEAVRTKNRLLTGANDPITP